MARQWTIVVSSDLYETFNIIKDTLKIIQFIIKPNPFYVFVSRFDHITVTSPSSDIQTFRAVIGGRLEHKM